ncbi:SprT-like family-domain-containing protein [Gongronella butleri]|nr:SprT-like family-domain-containing protein [Gongronella butleri]
MALPQGLSDEALAQWLAQQEKDAFDLFQQRCQSDEALALQLQSELHDTPGLTSGSSSSNSPFSSSGSSSNASSSNSSSNSSSGIVTPRPTVSFTPGIPLIGSAKGKERVPNMIVLSDSDNESDRTMDEDEERQLMADLALARELQAQEQRERLLVPSVASPPLVTNILGSNLDLDDPNPDLHTLFVAFNDMFFDGKLGAVTVSWSTRMTRCAGICRLRGNDVDITMSEPLLKFRPRSDMIDTLLHEMIHALHFRTLGTLDRDGHGPKFLADAKRINDRAGTNITVYHTFNDEVRHYQTHVWRCDGPCRERAPFYGWCKRSMNRPPQKADSWFASHQATCGGKFIKVSSPEEKPKRKSGTKGGEMAKKSSEADDKFGKAGRRLDEYFETVPSQKRVKK